MILFNIMMGGGDETTANVSIGGFYPLISHTTEDNTNSLRDGVRSLRFNFLTLASIEYRLIYLCETYRQLRYGLILS